MDDSSWYAWASSYVPLVSSAHKGFLSIAFSLHTKRLVLNPATWAVERKDGHEFFPQIVQNATDQINDNARDNFVVYQFDEQTMRVGVRRTRKAMLCLLDALCADALLALTQHANANLIHEMWCAEPGGLLATLEEMATSTMLGAELVPPKRRALNDAVNNKAQVAKFVDFDAQQDVARAFLQYVNWLCVRWHTASETHGIDAKLSRALDRTTTSSSNLPPLSIFRASSAVAQQSRHLFGGAPHVTYRPVFIDAHHVCTPKSSALKRAGNDVDAMLRASFASLYRALLMPATLDPLDMTEWRRGWAGAADQPEALASLMPALAHAIALTRCSVHLFDALVAGPNVPLPPDASPFRYLRQHVSALAAPISAVLAIDEPLHYGEPPKTLLQPLVATTTTTAVVGAADPLCDGMAGDFVPALIALHIGIVDLMRASSGAALDVTRASDYVGVNLWLRPFHLSEAERTAPPAAIKSWRHDEALDARARALRPDVALCAAQRFGARPLLEPTCGSARVRGELAHTIFPAAPGKLAALVSKAKAHAQEHEPVFYTSHSKQQQRRAVYVEDDEEADDVLARALHELSATHDAERAGEIIARLERANLGLDHVGLWQSRFFHVAQPFLDQSVLIDLANDSSLPDEPLANELGLPPKSLARRKWLNARIAVRIDDRLRDLQNEPMTK